MCLADSAITSISSRLERLATWLVSSIGENGRRETIITTGAAEGVRGFRAPALGLGAAGRSGGGAEGGAGEGGVDVTLG